MATDVIGTRQLRDELASIIDRLPETEEVIVTQRGEGRAVMLGLERYNQLLDRLEYLEDTLDAIEGEREGAVPADSLF
jgi:prevent-host-death family protein